MKTIDFDQIETWGPWVSEIFHAELGRGIQDEIASSNPEFLEDAADIVLGKIGIIRIQEILQEGLSNCLVRVFHATRVSEQELLNIQTKGLHPLSLKNRREFYVRTFSRHPHWKSKKHLLDTAIGKVGKENSAGVREDGKIHVCFSREGLINGCNHYLTHGAEVDHHVIHYIFGRDDMAYNLIKESRKPYIISFSKKYEEALEAANPFGFRNDELRSFVRLILNSWSYWQFKPSFRPKNLKDCTTAMFKGNIEPFELENFEEIDEAMLNSGPKNEIT